MSRKNKYLRAFLHQNPNPSIEQAWDAAWKHAQKTFHARSMQDIEKHVADLQAGCERLAEALEAALDSFDDWCEGQSPRAIADAIDRFPWVTQARTALSAHQQGESK